MGIDDSGYVYLSLDYNDGSAVVAKMDTASSNTNLWETTTPNFIQSSIAVDGQGNSFVGGTVRSPQSLTGHSFGFGDLALIKLDTNGNELWKQQVGSSKEDRIKGISVDHNGNILAAGMTQGNFPVGPGSTQGSNHYASGPVGTFLGGGQDGLVAKFDPQGKLLWARHVGTSYQDVCEMAMADSTGSIFVTGSRAVSTPGESAIVIAKFTSDGSQLWKKEFKPFNRNQVTGICIDTTGDFYVTGRTKDTTKPGSLYSALVYKFDTNGNQIWRTIFDGNQVHNEAHRITCGIPGQVVIGGWTRAGAMAPGITEIGGGDYFAAGLDRATGKKLWLEQFGTASWDHDTDLDAKAGRLVMAGSNGASNAPYVAMLK
jgi:hypothetical protein